jgi:hypothetical protein
MDVRPHLATLLSQVLVAYTIEVDYEYESLMPHRTALTRAAGIAPRGPWLISLERWANFLRYVTDDGISVDELSARSGIRRIETAGMQRWSYVTLEDGFLRPTAGGRAATRVWTAIEDRIEARWRDRFGDETIEAVRSAIASSVADIPQVGPDYLPSVGYGLWTRDALRADRNPAEISRSLSAVLCRALTVIAVAFERDSPVSLALAANVLRVLEIDGTPVRNVAGLAGIAKEITDVSLGYLEKQGVIRVASEARGTIATPTDAGLAAQDLAERRLGELDTRFEPVRDALERILSNTDAMIDTLTPHPEAWRANGKYAAQTKRMLAGPRAALTHFPIVTHRGGYPDGS